MKLLPRLFAIYSLLLLVSCAHRETVPLVSVRPNDSGLKCGPFEFRAAYNLIGGRSYRDGKPNPPDVPPGVRAGVERVNPVRIGAGRYQVRASGGLVVVSVENIRKYPVTFRGGGNSLEELRTALWQEGAAEWRPGDGGKEIPWMNAGRRFQAKSRTVSFPWGRASLSLVSYVQGATGGPVNNDGLVLSVQGLTNDGRYAVSGHFDIRHPLLPDTMDDEKQKGRRSFDIDHQSAQAEAWLDQQRDESFQPAFGQYITFLSALDIRPSRKGMIKTDGNP